MENKESTSINVEVNRKSIGKATVWSFAAEISAKLIVPITNMILARILVPEAFGIIATINVVVSLADTLSTAGFNRYIVQHEYENREQMYHSASVAFWTNLSFSVLAWLVIAIFRYPIARIAGGSGYEMGLMVASLSLPLTSFSSIQEAMFHRRLNYRVLFYRRIAVCLVPFFVTIPLALFGLGYWALIIGTLAGNLTKAILLTVTSEWKPRLYYNIPLLKEMFGFSMWTLLESIAMWASSYIDIFIISNKLGDYYTGLYKNSQATVTGLLTIITSATTSVLFASLCRLQNDQDAFERVLFSFQKKVGMFVLPIGVGIFCFSELITKILLGDQWMEASDFIGIWGLCTSLVCVFGTFSREVYRAKGKPKISLVAQLIHLAFVIPICVYGVKRGFDTLIYVRSFAYLIIIVIHLCFMKFLFRISPLKMFLGVKEPILCSILMGTAALLIRKFLPQSILLQFAYIAFCALFYFALLALFKPYREELKKALETIREKYSKFLKSKSHKVEG